MKAILSSDNTRWRDVYPRARRWALLVAAAVHVFLLWFTPRQLADRLHEALIPAPTVFFSAGSPGAEMEVVAMRQPERRPPEALPPPEPEEVEEVEEVVVEETAEETETTSEATEAPSESEGTEEGTPEGEGDAEPVGGGGGGVSSPPRPVHLVVPAIPDHLDKRRARGESVHLLVQVLPDGSVGEVRVEKGSGYPALDQAAQAAAQQMRYAPALRRGDAVAQWTRAEMRF